jgi:hypothetical protein
MAAGLALLMAIACVVFVKLDGPGLAGAGVGAGLGLLNLAVGSWITMRALKRGMKSAMATLVGGFFGRLVLVVGLLFAFQRTEAVDGVAFALVFMLFFFVYLGLEVVLVERALRGNGSPA